MLSQGLQKFDSCYFPTFMTDIIFWTTSLYISVRVRVRVRVRSRTIILGLNIENLVSCRIWEGGGGGGGGGDRRVGAREKRGERWERTGRA